MARIAMPLRPLPTELEPRERLQIVNFRLQIATWHMDFCTDSSASNLKSDLASQAKACNKEIFVMFNWRSTL